MVVKHMDILINDYINGERSLCRDEAQFSAYLFQILNGCKRVKIDSDNFTNKTYEVMQAYYMPAFLRDYFNYAEMDEVSKLAHEKGFVVPLKIITLFFGDGAFIVTPQLHI